MNIEKKLKELKINLPNPPNPVGAYVAYKKLITFYTYLDSCLYLLMANYYKGKLERT